VIISVCRRNGFISLERTSKNEVTNPDMPSIDDNPRDRVLVLNYEMALSAYKEAINKQRGKLHEKFVLLPGTSIPKTEGNFDCENSEIRGMCGFYVEGYEDAVQLCDIEYKDECNAFVLTKHMLVYLKKNVPDIVPDQGSSVFVKNEILKEMRSNGKV
jgi:hypothetical protein